MAFPNLSEIVTTTLRHRGTSIADSMSRNSILYSRMNESGRVEPFSGGRTITEPLEYANNVTYMRFSGYEALNITPSDAFTSAEFPIRQAAVAVSISGLEQIQNSGKEAVINLLKRRIQNAEQTAVNGMDYDMWSDGSLSGQILGLQALISSTPTVGTVGGIDRASWAFWQNQKYAAVADGGAAISAANIKTYMMTLMMRMVRGQDGPDMILMDNGMYGLFNASLEPYLRIMSSKAAASGFASLAFNGIGKEIPVYLAGGYQGSTTDGNTFGSAGAGAVGGPPASTAYFVNSKYLRFRPHSQTNWVMAGPDRVAVNQDALVKLLLFAGNMTLSNAFTQGVLTA